jgi:hypothetical protein
MLVDNATARERLDGAKTLVEYGRLVVTTEMRAVAIAGIAECATGARYTYAQMDSSPHGCWEVWRETTAPAAVARTTRVPCPDCFGPDQEIEYMVEYDCVPVGVCGTCKGTGFAQEQDTESR